MLIFVSYRRNDVPDVAGRLSDALGATFGAQRVFMDVAAIQPGDNFLATLDSKLAEATAMVVVIGPSWLNLATWDEQDFVFREVRTALRCNLLVVPVLAGQSRMPTSQQLPAQLAALATLNACDLSAPAAFHY